ncbi:anaerobic ribonucleoside-triphosphate reductase activating protein [Candidatus Parcubacteria bacterium]|nr:anaerobic ribonucleoside-triphosphate reductase activating protein [Candidatus Parcubacteria bacterium]
MIIGGLQKFSLLDYPDHISAIVFTQGCNFRCHFCYNPMLVWPQSEVGKFKNINSSDNTDEKIEKVYPRFPEDGLFDFLKKRQKKLDAIVITGGEPTIHKDLPNFIKKIKKLGFKVKLDTNGTNPKMMESLIDEKLIDYIAMDIKCSLEKYDIITEVQPDLNSIEKSIKIIMQSGLPYEFRTTVVPELIEKEDIKNIGELIKGAKKWYLQNFKSDTGLVNDRFQDYEPYSLKAMEEMREIGEAYVDFCEVR